jgi:hypothetical protein
LAFAIVISKLLEVAVAYVTPSLIVTEIVHVPAATIVTSPVEELIVHFEVVEEEKVFVPSVSPALAEFTAEKGESPKVLEDGPVIEIVREVREPEEIVKVPVLAVTV